jgi:hypothetical protein
MTYVRKGGEFFPERLVYSHVLQGMFHWLHGAFQHMLFLNHNVTLNCPAVINQELNEFKL